MKKLSWRSRIGVVLSGAVLGCLAAGARWQQTHHEIPIAAAPAAVTARGGVPEHPGAGGRLSVSLEPAAIAVRGAARAVSYACGIETEADADVRYVIEIIDDHGELVRSTKATALRTAGKIRQHLHAETPSDLRDGVYTLRVKTVAVLVDGTTGTKQSSVHFEIRGGDPTPLAKDEYLRKAPAGVVTGGNVSWL